MSRDLPIALVAVAQVVPNMMPMIRVPEMAVLVVSLMVIPTAGLPIHSARVPRKSIPILSLSGGHLASHEPLPLSVMNQQPGDVDVLLATRTHTPVVAIPIRIVLSPDPNRVLALIPNTTIARMIQLPSAALLVVAATPRSAPGKVLTRSRGLCIHGITVILMMMRIALQIFNAAEASLVLDPRASVRALIRDEWQDPPATISRRLIPPAHCLTILRTSSRITLTTNPTSTAIIRRNSLPSIPAREGQFLVTNPVDILFIKTCTNRWAQTPRHRLDHISMILSALTTVMSMLTTCAKILPSIPVQEGQFPALNQVDILFSKTCTNRCVKIHRSHVGQVTMMTLLRNEEVTDMRMSALLGLLGG